MRLDDLNALASGDAESALLRCCGSRKWAREMTASRPFESAEELHRKADDVSHGLRRVDWLQAFAAHPRIGQQAGSNWSRQEQAGMREAGQGVAQALADANETYYEKFGYMFIICATGKSAGEMLQALRARLQNDSETELQVAADEQRQITHLRIDKLLE